MRPRVQRSVKVQIYSRSIVHPQALFELVGPRASAVVYVSIPSSGNTGTFVQTYEFRARVIFSPFAAFLD